MSLLAFGAMLTSIFSAAIRRSFCPDLGFNFRDKSANRLLTIQDDTLALIDFSEPLLGRLPKRFQLCLSHLFLFFQKTQGVADDFAGVAVASRGNLVFDKEVKMFGQIDVACWHDRLLSLAAYHDWQ